MKETLESLKAAATALDKEKQSRAKAGTPNQRVIIALNQVLEAVNQLNWDEKAEAARLAATAPVVTNTPAVAVTETP